LGEHNIARNGERTFGWPQHCQDGCGDLVRHDIARLVVEDLVGHNIARMVVADLVRHNIARVVVEDLVRHNIAKVVVEIWSGTTLPG